MQFSYAAVAAALVATAAAGKGYYAGNSTEAVYTTVYTTDYTTVCPASTTFTVNKVTYTATESETITVTNCPCTHVYTKTSVPPVYTPPPPAFVNTTTPAVVATAAPTPSSSKPASFTGAANQVAAGSAAGFAGLLGLAAYLL